MYSVQTFQEPGKLARVGPGVVQADWQKTHSVFHLLVILCARYTTPPLPRVIKGSEWQALWYFLSKDGVFEILFVLPLTTLPSASASSPSSETFAATKRTVE